MSCPKCKDAKTPFCGSCGSRIEAYKVCPWCRATNDATNSFCQSCGEKIAFTPYTYSRKNITRDEMLRELLKANTRFDEKQIKRFVSYMEFNKDCQCSNCGEIKEIASARQRDLFGFFGQVGFSVVERFVQVIQEPDAENDEVEEVLGQELIRACLVCGNVWVTGSAKE